MPIAVSLHSKVSTSLLHQRQKSVARTAQSLERLSTGKRINRPSDDPPGFIAVEQLKGELADKRAQLGTYQVQRRSLNQQESTLASLQRQVLQLQGEVLTATGDQAGDEIRQASQQIVDATLQAIDLTTGKQSRAPLQQLGAGGQANLIDGDPTLADAIIDSTLSNSLNQRVAIASDQQNIDRFKQLLEDQIVITTETISLIEDADFAVETANLSQSQALTQAATVALVYDQRTQADLIGSLLDEVDVPKTAAERPA